MRIPRASVAAACIALLCCGITIPFASAALADDWTPQDTGLSQSYAATPTWSDEFESGPITAGASLVTQPDASKWSKINAQPQWNGERQSYVDDAAHSAVSGGKLHIAVTRNVGSGGGFQSAQISTIGKVSFKYGLFAARVRMTRGTGLWPSIWLFGEDPQKYEEISMVELGASGGSDGRAASVAWFSTGAGQKAVRAGLPAALSVEPAAFADDFHVFWLEWTPQSLTVGLDSVGQILAGDLASTGAFQSSMHLIVNVAVGGGWTSTQSDADVAALMPQSLQVEWVRYWPVPELTNAGIVAAPTPAPTAIPAVSGIDLTRGLTTPTTPPPSGNTDGGDQSLLPASANSAAAEQSASRWAHVITLLILVGAQGVLLSLL